MNLYVKVFGKVQNVSFRKNIFQEAIQLNLNGWIRNTSDLNIVEIFLQGNKKSIDSMLKFIKGCPGKSIIVDIKTTQIKERRRYNGFKILQ